MAEWSAFLLHIQGAQVQIFLTQRPHTLNKVSNGFSKHMRQRYHEYRSTFPTIISIYNALISQYFKAVLSSSFPKQSDKNLNYVDNSFCFHDYYYSLFLCNIYSKPVKLFKTLQNSVNNQPVVPHFLPSESNTGEVSISA
jgi:hypothetical protein